MILGLGTDIASVERIRGLMEHERFLEKFFSEEERLHIGRDPQRAAGHFAAKEAFSKAFGTGFGSALAFRDLSILHDGAQRPYFSFSKDLGERLSARGIGAVHLSISHEKEMATAVVILES